MHEEVERRTTFFVVVGWEGRRDKKRELGIKMAGVCGRKRQRKQDRERKQEKGGEKYIIVTLSQQK